MVVGGPRPSRALPPPPCAAPPAEEAAVVVAAVVAVVVAAAALEEAPAKEVGAAGTSLALVGLGTCR